MKVTVNYTDATEPYFDNGSPLQIIAEFDSGLSTKLNFMDGEPEDNNFGRNFSDVFNIAALLEMAHDAGKRGESLEVINQKHPDWDE